MRSRARSCEYCCSKKPASKFEQLRHLLFVRVHHSCAWEGGSSTVMKNDGKAISQADSAAISATVEAVLSPLASEGDVLGRRPVLRSSATRNPEYPVADLVGRCFLRVCFWIEICTAWKKKYHPPEFTLQRTKSQPLQVAIPSALMAAPAVQVQSTISSTSQTLS